MPGDLTAALDSTRREIDGLRAQGGPGHGAGSPWDRAAFFPGQVDGYEDILTPAALEGLSPSYLDRLEGQSVHTGADALCKLITDTTWYFICPLSEADASRLLEGGTVTARFSRDWSGEVKMTVERISAPENGRVAVTLSSTRFLSNTTLLRRQTVDLIFSSQSGHPGAHRRRPHGRGRGHRRVCPGGG